MGSSTLLLAVCLLSLSVSLAVAQRECLVTEKGSQREDVACQFPFVFKGVTYDWCTDETDPGKLWCSTRCVRIGRTNRGKFPALTLLFLSSQGPRTTAATSTSAGGDTGATARTVARRKRKRKTTTAEAGKTSTMRSTRRWIASRRAA